MCYTAGPRCSPHALTKLFEAKATFNQVDPTDVEKMNEAKHDLFIAEEEYLTSPIGIKKLRDKAKSTGENKYAVQANEYAAKRKQQIAVSKALVAEQKEALAALKKKESSNASPDAEDTKKYEEESRKLQEEFDTLEKFKVPDDLNRFRAPAEYDQDGTRCGYDGQCRAYPGDYCRDSEYINLHVDESSLDTRKTLAGIYNCNQDEIPDSLEKIGREELGLESAESYIAESEYGYYGVEGAHVELASPMHVRNRLNEYYASEHKKLKAKEAELQKSAPTQKAPAKSVARRRPGTSKQGTVKPAPKATPKRRERTPAELDAFEKDAMPDPADRKVRAPKAAKPVAPKRREPSNAELDAFERDALPTSRARKTLLKEPATKPVAPKRRERTPAELDAFEADERS